MMKLLIRLLPLIALSFYYCFSQDTISVLSYNILAYSSTDANKNRYKDIREVIKHTKPDVALFCEIVNTGAPQYLLDSSFNAAGVGTYSRAVFYDGNDTDNMLFYNPSKVKLLKQKQILTSLRDISQYVIYKDNGQGDTAKIYVHMAHLKAGSTPSDETQRNSEINAFCSQLVSVPASVAVIFAGDLNLKGSSEAAWNSLTSGSTCAHTFYDPLTQVGFWNNNSFYAPFHTQSTRTSAFQGCCGGATGGLDDRFDFILVNQAIQSGNNNVKYVSGSYKTIGNDGQHFNLSLLDGPSNTSVPGTVNTALFNISDHLPVMLKLKIDIQPVGLPSHELSFSCFPKLLNDISSHLPLLKTDCKHNRFQIILRDIQGKTLISKKIDAGDQTTYILYEVESLAPGVYMLECKFENSNTHFKLMR